MTIAPGTAVIVAGAIINALKLTGRKIEETRAVLQGSGAAGTAITKLLLTLGIKDIVMCDKIGRWQDTEGMTDAQAAMAEITNPRILKGSTADVIKGADIFIGVSAANTVTKDMIRSYGEGSDNIHNGKPAAEIPRDDAIEAGAAVVGTGRSDYPNQINNVLAFPGVSAGLWMCARAISTTR